MSEIRTFVRRPPASATWEHGHRCGPLLGDFTTLRVTSTDGGNLRICYGKEEVEIREVLVPILAEMITAAATWTDAQAAHADPTEAGGGK